MPTVRSSSNNTATFTATLTGNKPAGAVDGDYLVAFVLTDKQAAPTHTVSGPAGWVNRAEAVQVGGGGNFRTSVWTKVASGEPGSWNWTASLSCERYAIAVVAVQIGTFDSGTPLDGTPTQQANASSANIVAGGLTTAVAGALLLGGFAIRNNTTIAPAGTMTELQDFGGVNGKLEAAWETFAGPGATGTRTAVGGSAAVNNAVLIGIRANAAGSGREPSLLLAS